MENHEESDGSLTGNVRNNDFRLALSLLFQRVRPTITGQKRTSRVPRGQPTSSWKLVWVAVFSLRDDAGRELDDIGIVAR
jgi:hypothetical protein